VKVVFADHAWEDYLHRQSTDKNILRRINKLVKAAHRDPSTGIGKPEPLKHQWSGYWSRRITQEHRLVYKVDGDTILVAQCRRHY
jgi:toxin YoeB